MSDSIVSLKRVHKEFDGNVVLDELDLDVQRGETFTILGGSGTGKSVSIKLMIGLLRVDAGHVFVRDRDVTELRESDWIPVRRQFGMVSVRG